MKLLVAIVSSQLHRNLHNYIRGSWTQRAKSFGIEARFFLEPPPPDEKKNTFEKLVSDEIQVSCPAGPAGFPYKVREICKWANGKQIDNLFICRASAFGDGGSIAEPVDLFDFLNSNFGFDYAGRFNKPLGKTFQCHTVGADEQPERYERCYPWADGQFGYFLSRKAYREIADNHPFSTIDDLWVGQVLGALAAEGEINCLDTNQGMTQDIVDAIRYAAEALNPLPESVPPPAPVEQEVETKIEETPATPPALTEIAAEIVEAPATESAADLDETELNDAETRDELSEIGGGYVEAERTREKE